MVIVSVEYQPPFSQNLTGKNIRGIGGDGDDAYVYIGNFAESSGSNIDTSLNLNATEEIDFSAGKGDSAYAGIDMGARAWDYFAYNGLNNANVDMSLNVTGGTVNFAAGEGPDSDVNVNQMSRADAGTMMDLTTNIKSSGHMSYSGGRGSGSDVYIYDDPNVYAVDPTPGGDSQIASGLFLTRKCSRFAR